MSYALRRHPTSAQPTGRAGIVAHFARGDTNHSLFARRLCQPVRYYRDEMIGAKNIGLANFFFQYRIPSAKVKAGTLA